MGGCGLNMWRKPPGRGLWFQGLANGAEYDLPDPGKIQVGRTSSSSMDEAGASEETFGDEDDVIGF